MREVGVDSLEGSTSTVERESTTIFQKVKGTIVVVTVQVEVSVSLKLLLVSLQVDLVLSTLVIIQAIEADFKNFSI